MINYTRERASEVLKSAHSVILATTGPSGVQVSEFSCAALGLDLYLLLPRTSNDLFNLEQDDQVALHTDRWEAKGKGRALLAEEMAPHISLFPKADPTWYVVVKIELRQLHVLSPEGWGFTETLDLTSF